MRIVNTLAWALALVYATIPLYWLLVHPFTRYWSRRGFSPLKLLIPVWISMWIVAGLLTWPWLDNVLYASWLSWIPGAALIISAVLIYRRAKLDLSEQQVIGLAEMQPDRYEQRLVTTGIHARVRHPFYIGHSLILLGLAIGSGSLAVYALTAFGLLSGIALVITEDRELERRFGEEFRRYRQDVPAFWPKCGR
jgi:protein-S-isoprenylcysteine O-methyltransferase Ste14